MQLTTGNDGWTPLHWAAGKGRQEVAELLRQSGGSEQLFTPAWSLPTSFGTCYQPTFFWLRNTPEMAELGCAAYRRPEPSRRLHPTVALTKCRRAP